MVKCFALVFNTFKWFQQIGKIELHTAIHLLVLSLSLSHSLWWNRNFSYHLLAGSQRMQTKDECGIEIEIGNWQK